MSNALINPPLPKAAAARASVPALFAPSPEATRHFVEFFAANIRNSNTRRAYFRNVRQFADWCGVQRFDEFLDIEPIHVAAYIEQLGARLAKPSVKQHLAALRMLFDWDGQDQPLACSAGSSTRRSHATHPSASGLRQSGMLTVRRKARKPTDPSKCVFGWRQPG